ncbi:MAG: ABC transporter substrate-binding protein [Desulfomonile tiedjei]|nr:ABC transporter substrate-binding protein [Desulfomonile tiedjei]
MGKGIMRGTTVIFWCAVVFFLFQGKAVGEDTINIGYTGPLTGGAAYVGNDTMHGAMVAAKEINDEGGVEVAGKKYKVKIHTYDDQGVAAKAVAGMQRLKDKYDVPVIIQNLSAPLMGMLERNEKMGILLIGFFKIPEATTKGNKLILRHHTTSEKDCEDLVRETSKLLKVKTCALISDASDYGKSMAKASQAAFDKLGVKMVANEWLDERTQTDFRGQLTKIKAANPDVIMLTAHDEASAGVIKQAHELGIKTPFALSPGFQTKGEELTGPDLIEGYYRQITSLNQTPPPPGVARYRALYSTMGYKDSLGPYGNTCYAMVHTIVKAMQKAGTTTDALKIRQAAPSVVPIEDKYNTTNLTGFEDNGDGVVSIKIGKYHKGKAVPVN